MVSSCPSSTSAKPAERRGLMPCSSLKVCSMMARSAGLRKPVEPSAARCALCRRLCSFGIDKKSCGPPDRKSWPALRAPPFELDRSRVFQRIAHIRGRGGIASRPQISSASIWIFSSRSRSKNATPRCYWRGSPDLLESPPAIRTSACRPWNAAASIKSGIAAPPRSTPMARAALARASKFPAPRASLPSAANDVRTHPHDVRVDDLVVGVGERPQADNCQRAGHCSRRGPVAT